MYKIVKKKSLNPTVTLMEIDAPLIAKKAEPGQFIILRVDENGERIPLTVAGYDREAGTVRIIFQIVGATTEKLNHLNEGDYIHDFVGPLGVPTHTDGLKKVCVVGGGVGCAIALPVAEKLHEIGCEVHSIVGFRNKDLVILEDEFCGTVTLISSTTPFENESISSAPENLNRRLISLAAVCSGLIAIERPRCSLIL
jgi:ferredoxin/flavodoxin---NADP+ reductase